MTQKLINKEKLLADIPCFEDNGMCVKSCKRWRPEETGRQCISRAIQNFPEEKVPEPNKPIPLPVVRTGILQPKAFDDESITALTYSNNGIGVTLIRNDMLIGQRLVISKYGFSESFYVDIKEEIDYSKIPVGAVVEINNFKYVGFVRQPPDENFNYLNIHVGAVTAGSFSIFKSSIKSISILKMPEVGKSA